MSHVHAPIAVVLFTKNWAGKGQAGRYGTSDVARALAVAGKHGCSAVTFSSEHDADLLAAVPEGRFGEKDRPLLPAAKVPVFKQLVVMAEDKHEKPAPLNGGATDAPVRTKVAAMRSAADETATDDAVLSIIVQQGARHWPDLKAGDVVLAPEFVEGEYNGWWEAVVKARSETYATLEWRDFPDMPAFTVPITQIAPIHPECKVKASA